MLIHLLTSVTYTVAITLILNKVLGYAFAQKRGFHVHLIFLTHSIWHNEKSTFDMNQIVYLWTFSDIINLDTYMIFNHLHVQYKFSL